MNTVSLQARVAGWRRPLACVAALAMGVSFAAAAAAQEVRIFTVDAFQPVVAAMAPAFEKRSGHRVAVVHGTTGAIAQRIRAGEDFDLAVLPPDLLEALGKEGAVSEGSITALARTPAPAGRQGSSVYAGAVSAWASSSQAALSLLILLASEDTQAILEDKGLAAP